MKGNVSTKDLQEAKARVEQAGQIRTNAVRRLRRAEEAVRGATADVEKADEELKAANADLDQILRKVMSAAMRKGGSDLSLAMADLIARSLPQEGGDDGRKSGETPDLLSGTSTAGSEARPPERGAGSAPADVPPPSVNAGDLVNAAEQAGSERPTLLNDAA